MIWGCMTWFGPGLIIKIEGKMNADQYISILSRELIPTLEASNLIPGFPAQKDLIFQQDNDPKHTSAKAKQFFKDLGINVMEWPPQSPDLNPIEHLWSQMKRMLGQYPEPPKGVFELVERIKEVWSKIEASQCQTLIESMPRRMQAVIKSRGGYTKY